ncbi:toll/interleukin-1 receptor domain-containing protein [Shewanella algae]|uniref:toll/interleukin-1 receptor domain-containing protein n=1 Tax=Shewanella algae TaxID=38313 RepID=UPI001AADCE46|nr:toll/interleukin-1 receptor domain-containing protein [Shewanella algae]MBO2613127.1 toll/interleukin-1 receptor domain-containing protein [Shewanella algae]MBO2689043.1 toll/interleukin-1 receptor domain-containing protein [Shewanella algae]
MKKINSKVIKQLLPIYVSAVAALFSVYVILNEYKSIEGMQVILGVFGAMIGVMVAFMFAKIKDATDAPKIFISYAHEDKPFVSKLYKELEKTPYTIFWDQNELQVGDDIKIKLNELMANSDYIIFVGSESSVNSEWATHELVKAKELKKKILPVIIDESSPPKELQKIMYADFHNSFNEGMNQLIRALKATKHNKAMQSTAKSGD